MSDEDRTEQEKPQEEPRLPDLEVEEQDMDVRGGGDVHPQQYGGGRL